MDHTDDYPGLGAICNCGVCAVIALEHGLSRTYLLWVLDSMAMDLVLRRAVGW